MKIKLRKHACVVTREKGDPKYYGTMNGAGESRLLHAIKKALNAKGYNFIKKRMYKDGHMVDDLQQYLRMKSPVKGKLLAIYNNQWAVTGANDLFNEGECVLRVDNLQKGGAA
tara:strand:- start:5137 stop:5475 length:339 start_codon:yes stop_codon:yes gene_type:complete